MPTNAIAFRSLRTGGARPRRRMLSRAASCTVLALGPCVALGAMAASPQVATSDSMDDNRTRLSTVLVEGRAQYVVPATATGMGINVAPINIPQSIQVIPEDVLRDQGAQSLADAVRNAPGLSVQQGEGNRDEFFIRGMKMKSSFFLDGLRDDTWYYRPLYNVAHVDVLEGPAAIRFGRGGSGGLINVVTRKPVRAPIRDFTLSVGSWARYKGTFDVGGAVGESGAFRLMGMGEDSNSFRNNFYLHRWAINPKYSTDLGDRTHLDLSLSYLDDIRAEDRGIPSQNGRPYPLPRDTVFGDPDWNRARTRVGAFSARIQHQLNDHIELRNAFLVTKNIRYYQMLYPGGSVGDDGMMKLKAYRRDSNRTSYLDRFELVADFDTGTVGHKLVTGAAYSWQRGHDQQHIPTPDDKKLPYKVPVSQPVIAAMPLPYIDWNNRAVGKGLGVYAQDQMSFGEHWIALLGGRWDRFMVDADYLKPGVVPPHTSRVDTVFSPRAGLIFKPVPNDSIYVSATRTFTPQGSDIAIAAKHRENMTLEPEEATNYEIGNKLDLNDGKLSITAAVFRMNRTNVVTSAADGSGRLVNTGEQRIRGVQLSVAGTVTDHLSIYANYSHLNATNTHTIEDKAPAGSRVEMVPSNQASVWMRYAFNDHWGMGAGVHGQSWEYAKYDMKTTLPGYAVGELMAYYQADHYRVQLNIGNVTDRTYYPTASGSNEIMVGEPRNAMLTFSFHP